MKKRLSIVLAALMLISILAGCNPANPDPTNPSTTPTTSPTTKPTEPTTPTAEPIVYIPAPYTATTEEELTAELLEPVYYENENGPTIGVTLIGVIQVDGLYFRDLDNDHELDPCEDWRLTPEERTEDLITKLSLFEKAKILFNNTGSNPGVSKVEDAMVDGKVDFMKILGISSDQFDNPYFDPLSVFSYMTILDGIRAGVCRNSSASGELMAYFNNAIEQTTEYVAATGEGVAFPFVLMNNPINTGYPTTLGMAAAVMGDVAAGGDYSMIEIYAQEDAKLWLSKGYDIQYGPMNSLPTDPRWSKVSDTYGEDPEVSANIMVAIITAYQDGDQGLHNGSVGNIIKRFPGDGASYMGFEGHNKIGEWRLYPTAGSMEKYHLVPFQAAFNVGVSGIMTSYSRTTNDGVRTALQTYRGVELPGSEVGTLYDPTLLTTLLDTMGFKGFVNSDTQSLGPQAFGVEELTSTERIILALQAGADVFGETDISDEVMSAVNKGDLDIKVLEGANYNRILPLMQMGKFDNPYVDPENAAAVEAQVYADTEDDKLEAYQKQYVLLKNKDNVLPLKDTGKKVYISYMEGAGNTGSYGGGGGGAFGKDSLVKMFTDAGYQVVDDYNQADIAFLYVNPKLNNMQQIPVIDLVEGMMVDGYDSKTGLKTGEQVECTTLKGVADIPVIADAVHANGGKVIGMIKITNPWILTNLEPYCDGLIADFSSSTKGMMDILDGTYNPTGKLPVTLVSSNEVIAYNTVTEDGVTYEKVVSPCDVPGYDKDQYIDPAILAEVEGGSYAYCDSEGNYYEVWFGLSY